MEVARLLAFETCQRIWDVVWRGEVDVSGVIVPIECEAEVAIDIQVINDIVGFLDGVDQMISVLTSDVLDAKIVDDKSKANWSPVVGPKAGCVAALVVAVRV